MDPGAMAVFIPILGILVGAFALFTRSHLGHALADRIAILDEGAYDPARDPRFQMRLPLEDEDGPIGLLLIGPRSDLNRYNAAQLRGLADLTEPLAEALRAALKREQHAEKVHRKLGSVEERLARLEQSGSRLSPT